MRSAIFVVMLAGFGTAWTMAGQSAGESSEPSSARDVYVNKGCPYCHGYDGQGSVATGPRLAPGPLPKDDFFNFVRRPPNVMPPYAPEVLSLEELEKIYEYLESIPEPPDVDSIPALADPRDP